MVKSNVSKKPTKPSGSRSSNPTYSPTIASSNFRAIFDDHSLYNAPLKLMIKFLQNHPLYGPFDAFTDVVPLSTLFKCAFSAYRPLNNLQEVHLNLVDDSLVILSKEKFLNIINLLIHPSIKVFTPSMADITSALYQMGYQKKIKGIGKFKKSQLPTVWQYVCHYVIHSLSGRTGGIDNMGLKLLELVWSIFTGHDVNYGQILWDDFLRYIPKESPKEKPTKLTFARFWSLCILDLHSDTGISMGYDINFFISKDIKRYSPSSDQTPFGPIRRLPTYSLTTLGLETADVSDHIKATEGIDLYPSTPPLPSAVVAPEGTAVPSSTTLSNVSRRRKQLASKKTHPTLKKNAPKETAPTKKRKSKTVVVSDNDFGEDAQPIAILKKRKTTTTSPIHDRTDTAASQQAPVVLGVPADPFSATIEFHSSSSSEPVSSNHGDTPPISPQRDDTGSRPKVSWASRLHFFSAEELNSILLCVTHTLQTHSQPQSASSAHAR
ncbi:hypothetical protein Lser_V15G03411 [Lactuca serriola]